MKYKILEQFTDTPGGRYRELGKYSGEEFRDDILIHLLQNLKENEKLELDLDGVYGYPPSFLEEVFGGLVRKYNYTTSKIEKQIKFLSSESSERIEEIMKNVKNAETKNKGKEK